MRNFLCRLFGFEKEEPPVAAPVKARQARPTHVPAMQKHGTEATYPPSDRGIPVTDIDAVIDAQAAIIKRIRIAVALPPEHFDRYFMTPIRAVAKEIMLLPASETGTHQGSGGLFRLALEISFFTWQRSEETIFSGREGIERRRVTEPRWRYASWLAGLCCELYRPAANMMVTNQEGAVWPTAICSLEDWTVQTNSDHYYVKWNETASLTAGQSVATMMVHRIVPDECLQYLQEYSSPTTPILVSFLETVSGTANPRQNKITHIVNQVRQVVFARDEATRPTTYGKMTVGTHLEPFLLDGMRSLIREGVWTINGDKSRIWYNKNEGLFLVWKKAAKELIEYLDKQEIKGIPRDPQTLLEVLAESKVFEQHQDGTYLYDIYNPETKAQLRTVKFKNPLILFGTLLDEQESSPSLLMAEPDDSAQKLGKITTDNPLNAAAVTNPNEVKKVQVAEKEINSKVEVSEKNTQDNCVPADTKNFEVGKAIQAAENEPGRQNCSDLLGTLKPTIRELILAIIQDMDNGKGKHKYGSIKQGFAISVPAIQELGTDIADVAQMFFSMNWLWIDPEKPNRKMHSGIVINGSQPCQALILNNDIAKDLGLRII